MFKMVADVEADQRRVVTLGAVATKAAAIRVRAQVLRAFLQGGGLDIRMAFVEYLRETVRDSLVALHLLGNKRAAAWGAKAVAEMSAGKDLKRLLDRLAPQEQRKRLLAKYDAQALKVLDGIGVRAETALRKRINELIGAGVPRQKAVKELGKKFDELGLTSTSKSRLETIYRTQSQIAYNAGRWETDQEADIQEILWGYRYVTVGDDRVRPNHAILEGVTLPKDHEFWLTNWPPNGYNCRCVTIALFEKGRVKRPPKRYAGPDEGFGFNPGIALII